MAIKRPKPEEIVVSLANTAPRKGVCRLVVLTKIACRYLLRGSAALDRERPLNPR